MTIKSHGMQCHGAIESELQGTLHKVESLSEMPEHHSHHSHAVSGSLASSLSSQGSLNQPLKPNESGVVQLEDVKEVLSERDRHLCSINTLSRHVPSCVLEHIKAEGLRMLHDGFDDVRSHTGTFVSSGIGNEDDLSELSDISYSLLDLNDFPELVDCYEGKPVTNEHDSGGIDGGERCKGNSPIPCQGVWANSGAIVEGMESLRALEVQIEDELPRSKDDNDTHGTPAQLSFESGLSGDFLPKEECCKYFSPERHSLPKAIRYKCALLLVDISGFTKLSTTLDPERFSKAINNYFHLIVKIVETHGGDVLKFAGDALFAEWQESDDLALAQCAQVAIICGKEVVSQCSDYRVRDDNNNGAAILATLNVHCSLGVGELVGVHVGDHDVKREYIVLGDPIDQVSKALDFAALGEFAASPQALSVLSKTFNLHQSVLDAHLQHKPAVILKRGSQFFSLKSRATPITVVGEDDALQQKNDFQCLSTEALRQCQKILSLYVHSVVVAHDSGTSGMMSEKLVKKRHLEAAEIRTVYVVFIKPLVSAHLTGNAVADTRLLKLLNDIMNLVSGELARFSGHLRQFIVDDKGVILIGTFGLRGSTSPNMVAERALPATLAIYSALQNELGVKCRIGATIGKAYCGIIGGVSRHEYAVLGPSVNLAARLVSSPINSGILVDNSVRLLAHRSYGFNALPSVAAKGYNDLVPIYEPLSPLEKGWGKIPPNFVGRKEEVSKIVSMANLVATSGNRSRFVLVTGESGTGKRTMISRAIEQMRKLWGRGRQKNIIVTKYKSKESDFLIPFSIFGPILQEVLPSNSSSGGDEGTHESAAGSQSSPRRHQSTSGSVSVMSTKSSDEESRPSVNRIGAICREINAPPEFIELLGNLVGISTATMSSGTPDAGRNLPSINGLVSYMVRIFKRFTDHIKLVVIAVADIHQIDDMSWKVLQELFDTAPNILFICTAPVLSHNNFRVDRSFWAYLNTGCQEDGSFASIQLNTLSRASIHTMAVKTLARTQFSSHLVDDIMRLSGGMPHFANEILESVKRQQESRQTVDDQIKELPSHGSIEELLVNRIDECDGNLRNVLNLCAVWGSSFYFEEIYEVYRRTENSDSDDEARRRLMESLEVGTSERILVTSHEGGELGEADLGDAACYNELSEVEVRKVTCTTGSWLKYQRRCRGIKYTFCHEMWRSTILGMMLDERRRDLHKVIATTLSSHLENRTDDIESNLTLLGHWKASGESSQAVALALIIGKRFYRLGLHEQAVQLYKEVLAMWEDHSDKAETIGGLSKHLLSSVDAASLGFIIKLHIGLGQSLLASGRCDQSVLIYRNALEIFQSVESSKNLEDRSVVFQIYSGHFTATHLRDVGRVVDGEYEKSVARGFVEETRRHGDPIHYLRALALQSEMFGRLGELDHALETVKVLSDVYNVDGQSQRLCHVYGSDKAAQCVALSSFWYSQNGNPKDAVQVCKHVAEHLLPKMERRNIDNSFLMLYPLMWVMKDNGLALEARELFDSFVVSAFEEFYGGGAGTSVWLPLFEPILMVLELVGKLGSPIDRLEQYVSWALDEDNLRFGRALSYTLSTMGKDPNAISAEICSLLGDRLAEGERKRKLIATGILLVAEAEQNMPLVDGGRNDASSTDI